MDSSIPLAQPRYFSSASRLKLVRSKSAYLSVGCTFFAFSPSELWAYGGRRDALGSWAVRECEYGGTRVETGLEAGDVREERSLDRGMVDRTGMLVIGFVLRGKRHDYKRSMEGVFVLTMAPLLDSTGEWYD